MNPVRVLRLARSAVGPTRPAIVTATRRPRGVAIASSREATRRVLTRNADRVGNMAAFAEAALELLVEELGRDAAEA